MCTHLEQVSFRDAIHFRSLLFPYPLPSATDASWFSGGEGTNCLHLHSHPVGHVGDARDLLTVDVDCVALGKINRASNSPRTNQGQEYALAFLCTRVMPSLIHMHFFSQTQIS